VVDPKDPTYTEACNTHGPQAPVSTFTDDKGWYPGMERRTNGRWYYRDADASTVVPSRGNAPYSTRVVDSAGNPLTQYYGVDLGLATPLGSGNPSDDGVGYGTVVTVAKTLYGTQAAQIKVTAPRL
jgi:immune inhibitor A